MISSVSSSSSIQYQAQVKQNYSLSDEQKETLNGIISKYDSEKMSDDDKKTMMDEIMSANIPQSKDVKEILDAAGFEPPAKPEGEASMPPPPPSEKEIPDFMADFLEKQESGEVTQDDVNTLLQTLQQNGYDTSGVLFDQKS